MSDDTDIIKAKSPLLFAIMSFALRRLEPVIWAAVVYVLSHNSEHKDIQWIGKHLQSKEAEIQQLEHTK